MVVFLGLNFLENAVFHEIHECTSFENLYVYGNRMYQGTYMEFSLDENFCEFKKTISSFGYQETQDIM